jgi:hypothetical protein
MFADRAQAIRHIEQQSKDCMARLNRIMPLPNPVDDETFYLACELMDVVSENYLHMALLRTGKAPTASECLRK